MGPTHPSCRHEMLHLMPRIPSWKADGEAKYTAAWWDDLGRNTKILLERRSSLSLVFWSPGETYKIPSRWGKTHSMWSHSEEPWEKA